MRRNAAIFGLALLCLALAPGAASAAPGKGPKQDLVAGTGQLGSFRVHVNAQSGPSGEDPRGQVRFEVPEDPTNPFLNFNADVTCMDVVGSDSVLAGVTDIGLVFFINLSDNGEGRGPADTWNASFFFASPPQAGECAASPGQNPVTQGNFTAHDSTP